MATIKQLKKVISESNMDAVKLRTKPYVAHLKEVRKVMGSKAWSPSSGDTSTDFSR